MNPWLVLPAIVLVAALQVLLPVGLAARARRPVRVRCPLSGGEAAVRIDRAGLAEVLARPSLRRVGACSLWTERGPCDRRCPALAGAAAEGARAAA
jgi:hypothetical protein